MFTYILDYYFQHISYCAAGYWNSHNGIIRMFPTFSLFTLTRQTFLHGICTNIRAVATATYGHLSVPYGRHFEIVLFPLKCAGEQFAVSRFYYIGQAACKEREGPWGWATEHQCLFLTWYLPERGCTCSRLVNNHTQRGIWRPTCGSILPGDRHVYQFAASCGEGQSI